MATETVEKNTEAKKEKGKVLRGIVVSNKMKDTVVVEVVRYAKEPKYGKFMKKNKRYKADDKGNTLSVGDKVEIRECRPISKDKRHIVVKTQ